MHKLLLFLRSSFLVLGMAVLAVPFGTLAIVGIVVPLRMRYEISVGAWCRCTLFLARILCGIRYEVKGLDDLPEESAVVLSNHQSTWETIFFAARFPFQTWILKKSLLNIPLWGWGLRFIGPIAIDRKKKVKALEQITEQGRRWLAEGRWIIVFPQGHRTPAEDPLVFQRGGATLAVRTGALVVPVAHDAGACWPRSFLKKPGTIHVWVGSPIKTEGRTAAEVNEEAHQWVLTTLARMKENETDPT